MKHILFLLKMPFEDPNVEGIINTTWFCSHCALIEGALLCNPHWEAHIDIRRISFEKPREELIDILGDEQQWLPVLVLPTGAHITDPEEITGFLARTYSGAAPHP